MTTPALPPGGVTVDWLLDIVASNPTADTIVKAIHCAYALGQRDCARDLNGHFTLRRPAEPKEAA